ncbi:MAG TPA: methyltransferase domain-containing protein [Candidatus Xenobia bacterium]|jgi:SAM-dependent methyltransferase
MTTDFDLSDPTFVAVYDELPLWSSLTGSLLLDEVPLRASRLLDVGCGTGFPLLELAQRLGPSCRATGLDPWRAALDRVRQKIGRLGLENVEVVEGDAAAMPFPDATFDLVVTNLGLNNFADPHWALEEVRRVSRPGATLALATNARGHMAEVYRTLSDVLAAEGLHDSLAQHGFKVTRIRRGEATMRFADGTALLRHTFIRLGFLAGWKDVVGPRDERVVFERLENAFNQAGDVRLTIPLVYVESRSGV